MDRIDGVGISHQQLHSQLVFFAMNCLAKVISKGRLALTDSQSSLCPLLHVLKIVMPPAPVRQTFQRNVYAQRCMPHIPYHPTISTDKVYSYLLILIFITAIAQLYDVFLSHKIVFIFFSFFYSANNRFYNVCGYFVAVISV